jgi:PAS domain S-box-containing protein
VQRANEAELAFQQLSDAFFRVDPSGRILASAASSAHVASVLVGDLRGRMLLEELPEAMADSVRQAMAESKESQSPALVMYQSLSDENPTEWELKCIPLGNEYVIAFRDFTARAKRRRALRESERRYRSLVEFAPYAILVLDAAGLIVFANPAALELLEADAPEHLLGLRIDQFRSSAGVSERCDETRALFEQLANASGDDEARMRSLPQRNTIATLKGNLIDVERSIIELQYYGEPSLMMMMRDVSAEVRALRANEQARDFLERVLALIDSGVVLIGAEKHDIRLANHPAEMIFGYPTGTMNGLTFTDLDASEGTGLFDHEEIVASLGPGETHSTESKMRRANGQLFEAELSIRRLGGDSDEFMATVRDISDRKSAEYKLQESESRYRQVVNEAPVGTVQFATGSDGRLTLLSANPAAAQIMGRELDSLVGASILDVFPDMLRDGRDVVYLNTASSGDPWNHVVEHHLDDGRVRILDAHAFQSGAGQVTVMFEDVTDSIAAAESERKHQKRLSALAAELADSEDKQRRHLAEELHDRVSQALAVSRMQMRQALSEESSEQYEAIRRAVDLLDEAIRETRAITTELFPPILYELGLPAAIRWVCEELRHTFGMICEPELDDITVPQSDEVKAILFRATRELLVNVVKHGGVSTARVSLTQSGTDVTLQVSDEGQGFSAANAERVEGGFGLFSLQQRVASVGGVMDIASEPGEGTTVTITVPGDR